MWSARTSPADLEHCPDFVRATKSSAGTWKADRMKLVIAGSRTLHPTIEQVDAGVCELTARIPGDSDENQVTEVICGDAHGSDNAGALWAHARGIPVHHEPITAADVQRYGKYVAPKIRNARMADRGDLALVFWDGTSNGATDMAMRMLTRGKLVHPVCMTPAKRERRAAPPVCCKRYAEDQTHDLGCKVGGRPR